MRGRGAAGKVLVAALLALAAAHHAAAQEVGVPVENRAPILTLDDDRLFAESRFGKAVLARQDVAAQALIAENRRIEAGLEAEEKDLTTRRASMPREEFAPLSEAFNAKVESIRKAQDAKSRALTRQFDEEKLRFFDAVRPALAGIMQDRGAVAIIDKRAVFVGFENVDITTAAIQALDATLGDGSLPPAPAPPATP